MPIYEYQCGSCSHRLEELQKMSEQPLRDCPECGRPELRRLISQSSFRLKGSGWYVTDFRDPPAAKPKPEGEQGKEKKQQAESKQPGGETGKDQGKQKVSKEANGAKTSTKKPKQS